MGIKTLATAFAVMLVCSLLFAKKKKPEDITQTLELPKDPPSVITADLHRCVFRVTPLQAKGLLSAQTRDAVKALLKASSGENVVRIRAFVAGSGDLRRVPQIVSEVFTEHKLALPTVSVVQAGGLPLTGAQVLLESISTSKRMTRRRRVFYWCRRSSQRILKCPITLRHSRSGRWTGSTRRW